MKLYFTNRKRSHIPKAVAESPVKNLQPSSLHTKIEIQDALTVSGFLK